jgi:hypothetical protein
MRVGWIIPARKLSVTELAYMAVCVLVGLRMPGQVLLAGKALATATKLARMPTIGIRH